MNETLASGLFLVGAVLMLMGAVAASLWARQLSPAEALESAGAAEDAEGNSVRGSRRSGVMLVALLAAVALPVVVAMASGLIGPAAQAGPETGLVMQIRSEGWQDAQRIADLALLRERSGQWESAADTWGLLMRRHGDRRLATPWSEAETWGELAAFHLVRARRIQNQQLRVVDPAAARLRNQAQHQQIDPAVRSLLATYPGATLVAQQPLDMDGDQIEEVFIAAAVRGKSNLALWVLKWSDQRGAFLPLWSGQAAPGQSWYERGPLGFGEVLLMDPAPDMPVTRLMSNGQQVIRSR